MIIGPGNAELTGHPDRCGEEKSLTGKPQERGTQEGAGPGGGSNRDNSLRKFCYQGELQIG